MEEIEKLYQLLYKVATHFVEQSRMFSIAELQKHDEPTYEQIAIAAKELASLLESLATIGTWDEERIALNARQAALHMFEMAVAITADDQARLAEATDKLDNMPFI
ncbi:hypothetical protein [Ferrimonas balearica]|uniref:hypothetical protein n=1 Tax=Ferrimonas balearica TaxID=44012 RepID=UPI001C94AC93|nr:hypothetical protein [Ferrimonas balearica]MBY5979199.1 hypothetical protein [Ferrimonas balearica]